MTTTAAQIDLWRRAPSEHQRLEFKEAKTQFDHRKLYEYCVALANEGGGDLVLGVVNKPPRPVVGTRALVNPVGMPRSSSRQWDFAWTSSRSPTRTAAY